MNPDGIRSEEDGWEEFSGMVRQGPVAPSAESGGGVVGSSAGRPVSEKRLSQFLQLPTIGDENGDDLAEDVLPGRGSGGPRVAQDPVLCVAVERHRG